MPSAACRWPTVRPAALTVVALHAGLIFALLSALDRGVWSEPEVSTTLINLPAIHEPQPTPKSFGPIGLTNPKPPVVPPLVIRFEDASVADTIEVAAASDRKTGDGNVVTEPAWSRVEILRRTDIEYPRLAKYLDEEGVVRLKLRIGVDGTPREILVEATSGHTRLDQAALTAVARWKFKPAMRDGVPIDVWTRLPVAFRLEK
jgi:periplasmic protein TonB